MGAAKRFRVALSFPGEYRARIERIAEALARKLGREKVLYDRWYAGEFARPGLGVYLPDLYLNQSDLIVYCLCKRHAEKDWCGLEWRVGVDLIKRREEGRLMLLRLDDAAIPGLLSIDGYLDIGGMSDADVANSILSRLGESDRPGGLSYAHRSFTSKLPVVNPLLIGREEEIALLDQAWGDPAVNLAQVIAAGGTGKTALVDKWFRKHLGEATIFGWSFYSQGMSDDRRTSSDEFFADLIRWFGIDVAPTDSVYIKAEAIARRLREERVLLLLDGVEPLQDASGALRDAALKALLQELATGHRGLVVCTTRVRMDIAEGVALDLDNLTPEQGAVYMRSLKVEGTDEELHDASREYWNHALALTLLGTYLVDFCGADVRRRVEIPELMVEDGEYARRVIAAYERMFAGMPELDILRALGYFNRPAESAALRLVRPKIEYRRYQAALKRLHGARLILTKDLAQPIDCHPLVREYFALEATQEGHGRLYEFYRKGAPDRPDTLEEMAPLFYAVYHGCRAGRYRAALEDIYYKRINRSGKGYFWRRFGAFGMDLSLLANFFETAWTRPADALSAGAQLFLINQAGLALRALGRLADAIEPIQAAAEAASTSEEWDHAAVGYDNLSGLRLTLGKLPEAVHAARQAVDFAERSGDETGMIANRTVLAAALHQSGNLAEARRLFAEAERIQMESQPEYPILYSVNGYRYCDLLLGDGQKTEVIRRASQTVDWHRRHDDLHSIGLDHVSLGRARPTGSPEAAYHLDQAVDFLRRAGMLDQLPLALLARGTEHDLAEVFRIASRSGMKLYLADYSLAVGNLAEAERLINETGYHRRDRELAELRAGKEKA